MSKKILLIEDEDSLVEPLVMVLESAGWEVNLAKNGLDALNILQQYQPDLILLDINMPGVNSKDFLRIKGKIKKIKDIPTIGLSAMADPNIVKEDNVITVLPKPFGLALLYSKIKEIFKEAPDQS